MNEPSAPNREQLHLSDALTLRTNALCLGLEDGVADIFDLVTPVTAELLTWWFGAEMTAARSGLNFHPGQRQAILNTIVAHEVLGCATLKELYQQVAADALLVGSRLGEVSQARALNQSCQLPERVGTSPVVAIWLS